MVTRKTKPTLFKRLLIPGVVVLVVAGVFFGYKEYRQHKRQHQVVIPSTNPNHSTTSTNPTAVTDKQAPSSNGFNTTQTPSTTPNQSTSTVLPDKPSGAFVSNHHPNLSGSPAPSQEQSVCNTTPGASCTITFTKGSATKTLTSQVADSNGAVYWNWDVNGSGFTTGSWQITATATLNGQALSAQDSLSLDVQP